MMTIIYPDSAGQPWEYGCIEKIEIKKSVTGQWMVLMYPKQENYVGDYPIKMRLKNFGDFITIVSD